ncbi:MAG TPA: hypothetical protein VI168_12725 [Croceibacterium sp.]
MRSKLTSALALGAMLLATGCATSKEAGVRQGLIRFGLSEPMARCMAAPMADSLSIAQLKRLDAASKELRQPVDEIRVTELATRLGRLNDPEIVLVMAGAAAECSFGAR